MADNIAYSPTHPAVGNVAWQPYGPYATIALQDDGTSVSPLVGYPSAYPHVLNVPARRNVFADLAMMPVYQPNPEVMKWFMEMLSQFAKSAPRASGSGQSKTATTQQPQGSKEGVSNITASVDSSGLALAPLNTVATEPAATFTPQSTVPAGGGGGGVSGSSEPAISGNSIIGGPTGLLDIIAQSGAPATPAVPAEILDATRSVPWWYPLWHSVVSR